MCIRDSGTTAGTQLVKDIRTGAIGANIGTSGVVYGGKLYFSADDGVKGREFWVTDGTAAGTQMVKDIYCLLYTSRCV